MNHDQISPVLKTAFLNLERLFSQLESKQWTEKTLSEINAHFATIKEEEIRNTTLFEALEQSRKQIVATHNNERHALGRSLYDVANQLTGIGYSLSAIQSYLSQGNLHKADELTSRLITDLSFARENTRRVAHNLYPADLEQMGLIAALQANARNYDNQFHVSWSIPDQMPGLPPSVEMTLYYLVSEAFENIACHPNARSGRVQIDLKGHMLHLEITDDGHGLSQDEAIGTRLWAIHERVEEIGGTCGITLDTSVGTSIIINLPLQS